MFDIVKLSGSCGIFDLRPDESPDHQPHVLLIADLRKKPIAVIFERHASPLQLALERVTRTEMVDPLLDLLIDTLADRIVVDLQLFLLGGGDDQLALDQPLQDLIPYGRRVGCGRFAGQFLLVAVDLQLAFEIALEDHFFVDDRHDPVDQPCPTRNA